MAHRCFLSLLVAMLAVGGASSSVGDVFRDCNDCPELVVVVPGADMPAGLIGPIAVGRFEITRDEFAAFELAERLPSPRCSFPYDVKRLGDLRTMNRQHPGLGDYRPSGRDPAICISWIEAQAYVEWLSRKTGQKYRLPYGDEQQYFQSGDAATLYAWGEQTSKACGFANGLDLAAASQEWTAPVAEGSLPARNGALDCDDGAAYTAPVGSYAANAFGLFDTTGNVWEWTLDCVADPKQWPEGSYYPPCTARGGSWLSSPVGLSNQGQRQLLSSVHEADVGFRVVRLIPD
jgi:formylglycine-generating enzyme required for sulfatase activity